MRLYQIFLDVDEKAMFAKYQEKMEQKDEKAIERMTDFPNIIIA